MNNDWLYQVRVYFSLNFVNLYNSNKSSDLKTKLLQILQKNNADLLSQYDGFMGYVLEAEKNGIDNYPLYQWTKDSLENSGKTEKYRTSYTIYVNNEEVYSKEEADNLEKNLKLIIDKVSILRISKHDTNPANNPQPPSKYSK
ncbi:hypothetical protein OAC06_05705 [Alphaproteobacteria bacterium]|jgi:hypothetical protein|nr:hypothetical protein [Alphaproteobacteria bacterium]|tara:strand:+ start:75 stop:503 length:429 start_codon:yes stop_codon:yes gene_type:complete